MKICTMDLENVLYNGKINILFVEKFKYFHRLRTNGTSVDEK